MKIFLRTFLVAFLGFFLVMPATAQESTSKNVVKANIFSPLLRTGSFFYERSLNETSSIQLGFYYTGLSISDTKFRGIGITPEFRYYMSETRVSPSGFFIAPYLRFQNLDATHEFDDAKVSFTSMGGGLLVGYQSVVRNRVSLEGFLGPSYSHRTISYEEGNGDDIDLGLFGGFGVRAGVTIGLAF